MRRLLPLALLLALTPQAAPLEGRWRAVLDLEGGTLPFEIRIEPAGGRLLATICNGPGGEPEPRVSPWGPATTPDLATSAARISLARRGDSLVGMYRNVGNR